MRNWLLRVAGLVAIVGAGLGVAFGLGIIGDDGREVVTQGDNIIVIDEANVLAPGETEVEIGEGTERKFEVRALHDDGVEKIDEVGSLDIGIDEGELAPNFSASNLAGERVRLSEFRGKVVYLNFWQVSCPPCRAEMPDIQRLLDEHRDELVVLGVNLLEAYRPANDFIEQLELNFTEFLFDPTLEIGDAYKLGNPPIRPASYFIDAEGRISAVHLGQITFEEMVERFQEARSASAGRIELDEEDPLRRTGRGPA